MAAFLLLTVLCLGHISTRAPPKVFKATEINIWEVLQPAAHTTLPARSSIEPEAWIRSHSVVDYESSIKPTMDRPKAALISLVRNEELDGILQSMRQLEFYFNRRHNYPWVFFSEVAFTEQFKAATSNATSAHTEYHLIPFKYWSTPPNISRPAYYDSLDYLGALGVGMFESFDGLCS